MATQDSKQTQDYSAFSPMAEIIALPGAAKERVSQMSRRGRLPKSVTNIRHWRVKRWVASERRKEDLQADKMSCLDLLRAYADVCGAHEIDGLLIVARIKGENRFSWGGAFPRDEPLALEALGEFAEVLEQNLE